MSAPRPVISSAIRIGLCTLTSRITGLARDMLLVQIFALSWVQDAFNYAFLLPNLFRRLFGEGALAAVFVPTFTRTLEEAGKEPAWRLLARTLALLSLALVVLIVLIEVVILAVWLWAADGAPDHLAARKLLLSLTALMLPFMLTICVVALFSSILNCVGSFVPAALTPVILNVFMIAALVGFAPLLKRDEPQVLVYAVAASVLAAGIVQILVILPVLRVHGVRLGWRLQPRDPQVRRMLGMMGPVALGQGVLLVGVFLDAQICALLTHVHGTPGTAQVLGLSFAYPLEEGALSTITVAQRLYQFPLGVMAVSLATAALPTLSRLAAREDWDNWSSEIRAALRMAVFTGLLAGGLMILLAEPIVRLLFEYRNFDSADTLRAARVLRCYGFGMWAFCAQHIVLRGFYSLGDVVTPLKISCVFLPLNVTLSLILIWVDSVREAAFGISTSVTSCLAVLTGLAILHYRKARGSSVPRLLVAIARMLAAAALSVAAVAWLRLHWLAAPAEQATIVQRAVEALGSLGLGVVIYLAIAAALRLPEPRTLLRRRPPRPGQSD
ncbi:MAG: murein biosynthesis integral membrane protein MurJ [Planctomycetes bacterium]|nr:murein biosynthesis integral membrane protein MurJ [Planctomycetota bacterium]